MSRAPAAHSKFHELIRAYYHVWFRYHPEAAVDAGVPGYAHLLTPYGEERKGALVYLHDELRMSLEELDRTGLTDDQKIDFDVLYGAVLLENQYLLEIEPKAPDPGKLLPVYAIYQLTIRPVEDFEAALLARLNAIPVHLTGAQDHLRPQAKRIPPLWLESAATAALRGADFLQALPTQPLVAAFAASAKGDRLDAAINKAGRALIEYAQFLQRDIAPQAEGEFACGQSYFHNMLRYRHFLDIEISELYAFGEQLFAETERELKDVCKKLYGHVDLARATREIQADHPDQDKLLATYRQQMQAAREFVSEHDLVTLPKQERLDVVETPIFLQHQIPFAAYSDPAPNDAEQQGYYYVTPPADEEQLAEHNNAGLMHTCVHEAWPGHHLQFVTANLNETSRTLPRLLNASATLYEGWALYCEQLMHEQGFLSRPEQRFILLKDRLWRALRVMIDVEIHTRDAGVDQAADRMAVHLGFPKEQALADLKWYTQAPTTPMGYATGWALINALRDRLRLQDPKIDLKSFHDRVLSTGSIALPLAIKRAFSERMWSSVKTAVFANALGETAQ